MRAPTLSEPNSTLILNKTTTSTTFPTYQVPQASAMRGGNAPPPLLVQVDGRHREMGAESSVSRPPNGGKHHQHDHNIVMMDPNIILSVINGSSCHRENDAGSNIKNIMQSVTDNCLLNSITVPKIQRNDRATVAHNNNYNTNNNDNIIISSDKSLDDSRCKFGALPLRRDIPNQKSEDLETGYDNKIIMKKTLYTVKDDICDMNNDHDHTYGVETYDISRTNLRTTDNDYDMISTYPPLRLRGGGESALSTGATGWGTPPAQQSSSSNANKANANGQQPTTSQSNAGGWAQPKPQNGPNGPVNGTTNPPASGTNNTSNATNNANGQTTQSAAKLEELKIMREAIFSQDGWGGQHVNQDTNWEVPPSPEPPMKIDGAGSGGGPPPWKPTVNNGTELWEANLRNGGQPPPPPQQKTPWGHTPSSNIGGTWGEDDDSADSSSVWTGVPAGGQQQQPQQQQWGGNAVAGGGGNGGSMWGGGNSAGWGDPRSGDPRSAAAAVAAAAGMDMRPEIRDMRTANLDPRQLDPREQMRQMSGGGDMRGDPRGITGRLNGAGAAEAFWGQTGPHTVPGGTGMHHQNKMPVGPGGNGAGWEETSPPSQRRTMPNYDDGTSLWGNPQQGGPGMGRGGNPVGPPGMPPTRSSNNNNLKPDGSVWGQQRNGWDDVGGPGVSVSNAAAAVAGGAGGWDDNGPWPKQKMGGGAGGGGPLWDDDWNGGGGNVHKPAQIGKSAMSKEYIWNSKQFRALIEMGYKKEDVETVLRMRGMNIDEAQELLGAMCRNDTGAGGGGWGNRHDDHYDHPPFPNQRYPSGPAANPLSYPQNNQPNLLNMNNAGSNSSLINNISPAAAQKLLNQGGVASVAGNQGFGGSMGGRPLQPQNQPSTQQLKVLVQQIQMAVQAGFLNQQILSQPLAPPTLVLLSQLLQQMKTLQQLNNQQSMASQCMNGKSNNAALMQLTMLTSKTKQQIAHLQNQIASQQAIYVNKQQHHGSMGGLYDSFKSIPIHDSINALQGNFVDLGISNKEPQVNHQQSRLNQWINKDKEEEFSRAPGPSSKPLVTSPNIGPLGLTQPDGPWSSGRTGGDTGWPDVGNGGDSSNDVKDAQWSTPAQPSLTDLVPEFEPGKPWKGNQKSIEDDPTITPGSVVRSTLSIATIKDNELFSMNPSKSPPASDAMQPLSLSSSTWSFNATPSVFTSSPQNKLPTSKTGLGDLNPTTAVTSELWGAPKLRGPPPGLSGKSSGGGASLVNGWSSNLGGGGGSSAAWSGGPGIVAGGQRGSGGWGGTPSASTWLLLKNLTAQIDGSTLRTLCMQHGPLQGFHLYLHQGFALAKYSSREEAVKAQTALNNCVLGNTTILTENPTDWDANSVLHNLANQQTSSSGWRASGKQTAADTWSTGWSNNPTAGGGSLWSTPLDTADAARATPSSLNSFLPNDLLGGESM